MKNDIRSSVTRFGYIWAVLEANFLTKVVKIFGDFDYF